MSPLVSRILGFASKTMAHVALPSNQALRSQIPGYGCPADIQRYCERSQRLRIATDEDHHFLFDSSPVLLNSPNTGWQKQTWQLKAEVFPMRPKRSRACFVGSCPSSCQRSSVEIQ